jgi:hypothetical protein
MKRLPVIRLVTSFAGVVLLVASCTPAVEATVFQSGDRVHITPLHKIDDDVIAAANNVTVSGSIDGDLITAAYDVDIQGEITGSVNILAYQLDHSGRIERSLRVLVNDAKINGYVGGSLVLVGSSSSLGRNGMVARNADIIGDRVTIDGVIQGSAKVE